MTQPQPGPGRRLQLNPEKILIALIFVSLLLLYFITGNKELKNTLALPVVLSLEIFLAFYYIYLIRNLYSLFLAGFIILNLGYLLVAVNADLAKGLVLAGLSAQFCLGIFLGYKTVKESIKNKDWELFGTLITLALLYPLLHYFFFASNQDYLMVYNFALAFMLGTIIYNENLWDKYNSSEKKILLYLLVYTMVEVLFISLQLI